MEERKRTVSPTQLNMYERCPKQWEYRYARGIKLPPSVAMVVGSAVDESVTANLAAKISGREMGPDEVLDQARDSFEGRWRHGVELSSEEVQDGIGKTKGAAIDRAVSFAGAHAEHLAPSIEPKMVQRSFALKIPDTEVHLVGAIDIDEGNRIRDTKTSKRKPNASLADESTQLTTYALAKKVEDGVDVEVKLDALWDPKTKGVQISERSEYVSRRDDDQYRQLLLRIDTMLRGVESGVFHGAPEGAWWCGNRWCGYWHQCPFARRPASISVPENNR